MVSQQQWDAYRKELGDSARQWKFYKSHGREGYTPVDVLYYKQQAQKFRDGTLLAEWSKKNGRNVRNNYATMHQGQNYAYNKMMNGNKVVRPQTRRLSNGAYYFGNDAGYRQQQARLRPQTRRWGAWA